MAREIWVMEIDNSLGVDLEDTIANRLDVLDLGRVEKVEGVDWVEGWDGLHCRSCDGHACEDGHG